MPRTCGTKNTPPLTPDQVDSITKYFWSNLENSDTTISNLFNVDYHKVEKLTRRLDLEHNIKINKRINNN